mmetsp:Transcript_8601/g.13215  ORF Transcript_8601/g.13215 Transcript_8601/m.13215 type:complete len:89 (-) Transcript_8601:2318-2584(-)
MGGEKILETIDEHSRSGPTPSYMLKCFASRYNDRSGPSPLQVVNSVHDRTQQQFYYEGNTKIIRRETQTKLPPSENNDLIFQFDDDDI